MKILKYILLSGVVFGLLIGGLHCYNKKNSIMNLVIENIKFEPQFLFSNLSKENIDFSLGHYQKNWWTREIYYLPVQNNKKWMNIITGADYDSFTPINLQRSKDKNYYYLDGKITDLVTEFNPIMLGAGSYIVDDNYVYDGAGEKIEGIDRKSFQLLGIWTMYAKDKNNIYIGSNIFTGVDYDSFQGLTKLYSKDKNNVYILRNIVTGADSSSFESLLLPILDDKEEILYDAKDNKNYYKNGTIVLF